MQTVFALLCFVVVIHWLIFPYPSGLLHWHCGNLTIAPVPAKQPWWIWINTSCEFIMNDCITTTKQSTTKHCAYFLGYTVRTLVYWLCRRNPDGSLGDHPAATGLAGSSPRRTRAQAANIEVTPMTLFLRDETGPRFTNSFSIAIQIRWKFRFTLISILIQWSLQNFVHDTTAVLSWHVQKCVAI